MIKVTKNKKVQIGLMAALVAMLGTACGSSNDTATDVNGDTAQIETAQGTSENDPKFEDIDFSVGKVNNDKTGNWRICTIVEFIEMEKYALDYYNTYFESDQEVHAITNWDTTTKITAAGNILDVTIYEYVDHEEHDAKLLFTGMLLQEYHVDKETGEITQVQ